VDVVTNITVLLILSVIIQLCSLVVFGLMAGNVSALLKAYMIVHCEKIARWKYGRNSEAGSTDTVRKPIEVPPLREQRTTS